MRLAMMLPLGVGALGDGRPVHWSELREMVRLAEAVGFHAVMAPDHLLFRNSPPGNVPPVVMAEGKTRGVWEVWSVLAAVAEATRRVQLGPFVACTGFRNPALLAKMADTLDEISDGRVILGLGAGWHEPEYTAFGYPFDRRVGRFEEALQIVVPLLRQGRVDFQGQYYQARDCELAPRGPRPGGPPILIGGAGPRMLRLVARFADLHDTEIHPDAGPVPERIAALDPVCVEVGRDPARIGRTAGFRLAIALAGGAPAGGEIARYELGGMGVQARRATPEDLVTHLLGFEAAGVGQVTCVIVDPPGLGGIERFAPVIEAVTSAASR
jgi:alkanesulfonate monooxygenase SsuD/methylene tetrahydromethanopterin reductase-like flavin-dependent oxidoreductase (luciferase family)